MQFVYILFAIGISSPIITVQSSQENGKLKQIEPIQIVEPFNKTLRYVNNNTFEGILNSDEIKDCYVTVVSITGHVQTGRSLLLNFFLNYLRTQYKMWNPFTKKLSEPLIGNDPMKMNITNGFKIEANSNGTTKGIWAWPEIFIFNNNTGHKVAIILLDTEGLFNHMNNVRRDTMIFALSSMFSSMLGFSDHSLGGKTLQMLDVFIAYTMYGINIDSTKATNITTRQAKAAFQSLNFIIRDWPNESESGEKFLERVLHSTKSSNESSDENRDMKDRIISVFESIHAFDVASTPKNVKKSTFDGTIDPSFLEQVKEMVPTLLAPKNIIKKKINGKIVKAGELPYFFKSFTSIIANMTITTSLLESIVNASNWRIYDDCVKLYHDAMSTKLADIELTGGDKPYFDQDEFEEIHREKKNASVEQFDKDVNIDVKNLTHTYKVSLDEKIEQLFGIFNKTNGKMTEVGQLKLVEKCWLLYNESMQSNLNAVNQSDSKQSYYEPDKFEKVHNKNRDASIGKFQNQVKNAEELETGLIDHIALSFLVFKQKNEEMYQNYLNSKTIMSWVSWALIGLSITVVCVYAGSKFCRRSATEADEENEENNENEKNEQINSEGKLEKV